MKKFRGKALAAVLSLALVVSSFPVTFASASTKKSMSGIVNNQQEDDIYLVNGGGKEMDLNAFEITSDTLQTKDREDVDAHVAAISHVSGDSLVSLYLSGDDDETAKLKLKSSTKDGTEVISILYKGTYTDDDGNDFDVKARKNVTVHVFDKDAIVFGEAKDPTTITDGDAPDDFKTFPQTRNFTKSLGIYMAEPKSTDDTDNACLATYQGVYLTGRTDSVDTDKISSSMGQVYSIDVSNGKDSIHLEAGAGATALPTATDAEPVQYTPSAATTSATLNAKVGKNKSTSTGLYQDDASTTNVTLTLRKVDMSTGKVSKDSDDKYTLKTKVEKKVDVAQACQNAITDGLITTAPGKYTISKDSGKTRIKGVPVKTSSGSVNIDVTNAIVVFDDSTADVTVDEKTNLDGVEGSVKKLTVGDGHVGYADLDNGDVELSDGKIGNITTDGTTGNVTINSGNAGNIKTKDVDVDNEGNVTVNGGTVGDITSNDKVTMDTTDEDTKISAGTVKAPDMEIYADEAAVTVSGIKAKKDGTITLKGSDLTVKSIDLDSFDNTLTLGDDDDAFVGTIPAPANATKGSIETANDDTKATVTGAVNVDTINLASDTTVTFPDKVTAKTVEGDGSMVVKAGNLYVSESVSSTKLKLSDSTLAAGTTVFKADADAVDTDDFDCYGFTLTKSEGNSVDTFKINTLSFAGLQINKSSSSIAKDQSETFTASAYPGSTSLPTGYTVGWELDGGSSDVFTLTSTGNTATVKVNSIDSDFASENHTTLTAKLYDEDGYEVDSEDYGDATCDITAIAVPVIQSDTTKDFTLAHGATYRFKITDATAAPVMTAGTAGVVSIANYGKSGNDYFINVTAKGATGAKTGIYVNGTKLLVLTVGGAAAFTSDTTKNVTVKKGASYQYKITSSAAPTFTIGSAGVFHYTLVSHSGNNYFYKITAVGAVGATTGVYVNGTRVNVAKVG